MFFLDTNTCIYFLNGTYDALRRNLLATPPNDIAVPSIVKAELLLGAYKSRKRKANLGKLEMFLQAFEVVPFSDRMTYVYSEIRSTLEKSGTIIGPNNLLIASVVKFHDGILITNNVREFRRVRGLAVEDWTLA
jgi:tRNA(fMet)-specific endonuclease VapC